MTALLLSMGALFVCAHAQERTVNNGAPLHDATDSIRTSSITAFQTRTLAPSRTLSSDILEKMSAQSVADALKCFAGVQVKDYGGIGGLKTVNVRSLGAQHVGIFHDGIRINNAQNGQVDLGRYSLDNMEAVSVYNAQKSESLQSAGEYSSGSTVHLRTKVPVFEGKPWNMTARLKAGSFGTVNPSARFERKLGAVSVSADASYLSTRGDYKFRIVNELEDTTGRRSNGDVKALRADLGLWARPWGGDLQVHAWGYKSERGLPGPVVRRLSEQYAAKDRQWDDDVFLQASYRKVMDKVAVLLNTKGSFDRLEYLSDPEKNVASPLIHNHFYQREAYASAALAWYPADWVSTNIALDQSWSDLRCDVKLFDYVQRLDTKAVGAITLTHEGFALQGSALFTRIEDISSNAAEPLTKVSPTLAASWHDSRNILTVRSFYKHIFRAPTFNDLYYTLTGNAHLRPEHARQTDIGLDLSTPAGWWLSSKLSVDGYLNRVTDKIVAMPVSSQFRWTMMNFGKVRGEGVNLSWDSSFKAAGAVFTSLVTYSYEEAREMTDPERIGFGGQIPYVPWHSGSVMVGAERGAWKMNVSSLFTGRRYRASDNSRQNRLEPWSTVDLSLSREFRTGSGSSVTAGVDVNNVLGQRYEVVSRYPMPGTSIMLKTMIKL